MNSREKSPGDYDKGTKNEQAEERRKAAWLSAYSDYRRLFYLYNRSYIDNEKKYKENKKTVYARNSRRHNLGVLGGGCIHVS